MGHHAGRRFWERLNELILQVHCTGLARYTLGGKTAVQPRRAYCGARGAQPAETLLSETKSHQRPLLGCGTIRTWLTS